MKIYTSIFQEIVSTEALFNAWAEFRKGKRNRRDVQGYERNLERNIFRLHRELKAKAYRHGAYGSFFIHDPKLRHIRKAYVRDRLVHQAVYTVLMRIFEPRFIHDLYSSRIGKGTHRGVEALRRAARKVSRNNTRPAWALKCDVRKFYDSVDHEVLIGLLRVTIHDPDALWLCEEIIRQFNHEGTPGKGVPIGNLTSQIFTNIYLNELDQFVKRDLRSKYYIRFADDFLLLSHRRTDLEDLLPKIRAFLTEELCLELHPKKVSFRPLHQGIDFLGYVTLPHHRVLRTTTRRRMFRKLSARVGEYFEGAITTESMNQTLQSYLGILSHADTYELQQRVRNEFCWR